MPPQINWTQGYEARDSSEITETVIKVVLEKFRYAKQFKVARYVLESLVIEQRPALDYLLNEQIYELSCHVMAEKLIDKTLPVSFDNPTTWWDMFKIRFFPGWLICKFPPLYTLTTKHVHFEEYATYPQLKEQLDISERGEVIIRSVVGVTESKHEHEYIEEEE